MDKETGMYYYGARYYDPRISIFISVDPLAEQTMESYLYTGNNPIMFTDPTGMSAESCEIDPPKKEKPKSTPLQQATLNVGKKYLSSGIAMATDPIGTAKTIGGSLAKEFKDFINEDKIDLGNFAIRQGG